MTTTPEDVVRHPHLSDHQRLLAHLPRGGGRARLDGIVVPSIRSARHLEFAVRLAAKLRVPIVVMTTKRWSDEAARRCLQGHRGAVVKLRKSVRRRFFDLSVGGALDASAEHYADAAAKRNLGLRLGRAVGWQTLLFLDDDIRNLTAPRVVRAVHGLRTTNLRAVGFRSTDFPDNSVVCHLRRKVGLDQGVFIGTGALLVDLDGVLPFFPPVYNEDWLFLYDWVVRRQVASAGKVRQLAFDPYRRSRARREEFGDVLAEGIYELAHSRWHVNIAREPGFWTEVLAGRQAMLATIRRGLDQQLTECAPGAAAHDDVHCHEVLDVARRRLESIQAIELATFISRWRSDLKVWREQLAAIKPAPDLGTALARQGFRNSYVKA